MHDDMYYFCDESSFLTGPIMSVGGLAIVSDQLASIRSHLQTMRDEFHERRIVKYTTTRESQLPIRKAYVEYLWSLIQQDRAHFHIRFAPFFQYDHTGEGKRYETTSKMYFQLLLHRAVRFYGTKYRIHIRPDGGDCTSALAKYVPKLNRYGVEQYGARRSCIESLEPSSPEREPILQLLDVPLGSLTAYRLGRPRAPDTAAAKRELANHTFNTFGRQNLYGNTPMYIQRYSIWTAKPERR